MQIAQINQGTGRVIPGSATYPGPDMTPEKAAEFLGWKPGTWREITPEEAAALQAPTPEELAARRVAEIKARLNELDLQSIRPLRAITDGTADAEDREKLAAINAEIEMLRTEMQGVEK